MSDETHNLHTTEKRVTEVFRDVREAFQRAGYQPGDLEVGRILRSMLKAHELMALREFLP
jgi:hypothetical protein